MKKPDLNIIKVIALDMDGTLLDDNKNISASTDECIKKLQEKGILTIIITGRSFEALKPYKEKLNLATPVICYNGAQVIDGKTEKILQNYPLPDRSSRFIIDLARKEDIHFQAYKDGILYFEKRRQESDYYENHVNLKGEIVDFDDINPFEFTKMMYVGDHGRLEKAAAKVLDAVGDITSVIFSNTEFLEFMHRDVSKGKTLLYVLESLGILPEETIAFGDGDNDISLLQAAGIGAAMVNASAAVKKVSDFITLSNNEDGIPEFLSQLC